MDIQHIEDLLREHPFFAGMNPDHVTFLAGCGRNVRFDADQLIFRDGTPADAFYILREGKAAINVASVDREPLTIETLEKGDVVGWSWLFPPYTWHFNARAVEPIHAVAMDATCLRKKIEGDHDLGYDLMKRFCAVIIARLNATQLQLLDIYK